MKSVLRSVKPYWFYLICEGKKKVEVGKTAPQSEEWDNTVCLYCSKDKKSFNRIPEEYREKYRKYLGAVGAKCVCEIGLVEFDNCRNFYPTCGKEEPACGFGIGYVIYPEYLADTCLTYSELEDYWKGKALYTWEISDLKIYDTPRELSEFKTPDKPYHKIIERDGSLMFMDGYESGKPLKRAPQSWQYVEER